ncbi:MULTISPECIES: SCO family protein [unclassified Flavobacterium]|uniref:SCO family protein n=1 Tax=unclassified Flavobacterium TaxID=196869 RepID=UPI0012916ACA|nr:MULTISPECIES: SCO family protein [unclassified Flavobacterium]MQP51432.1 SCO family protein [Flavobacterium sp. LMO9]MQP61340.1 SCO family protein [Flavobacterium sp. LMO6]
MLNFLAPYKKFLIIFSILSLIIYIGIYTLLSPEKMLPIYSPRDINPELVDSTVQHIGNDHKISDFSFTNQNGKVITQKDYENTIYVADFFFTTCPTICPKMTDNMVWLQNQLKNYSEVKLLSFSVTPDIDTPEVLKEYALEKGVDDARWNLVTGDKSAIYYLARKSYLAVKTGKPEELYDMVHTENFILVDKNKRIRGFYDGTNLDQPTNDPKTKNMKQLLEDIIWLNENQK